MAETKKILRHVEIEPAANGGHTVRHHYKEQPTHSSKMGMSSRYVEPESFTFGPEQGHEMLAHVANHLHIPAEKPEEREGGEDEDGEGEGED